MILRPLTEADRAPLAELWFEGWTVAHAAICPPELVALRSRDDFRRRIDADPASFLVTGPPGAPEGFVRIVGAELDQVYVAPDRMGTGLAAPMMAAAEAEMAARGIRDAHLIATLGNDRAARFYERQGWRDTGIRRVEVGTSAGPFALDVRRFEKRLA
ncbi:Ribosomal protein S18 acetylase RimI [Wenxinia saemankumensis]|uniref:Ribosomal protein S18 acetylase RimI n=1 Tax=Wenxinia saemankumensis TaxID=1447782 RepID=A0A1M6EEY4_9RHOB|nr:GNAT family N-acetyltransferase [Wenxinia saemankumensis]SHI84046.1 Ribosomal protein S18 acetylase RimI [Wenxinia saemankumensis]